MLRRQYFDVLPSTQEPAVELAREGAEPGTRVVAAQQSSGRGRREHSWASPLGGLYLSIVREGRVEAGPLLSVSVAAGLCDLLASRWGASTRVRWPNDIVCPSSAGAAKKMGGILLDSVHGAAGQRTVVGIGLNVNASLASFPPELRDTICSLREHAHGPVTLEEVEAAVGGRIEQIFGDLAGPEGQARWRKVAQEMFYGRGLEARIDGTAVGIIEELADDGALRVRSGSRVRSFYEGTLSLGGAA